MAQLVLVGQRLMLDRQVASRDMVRQRGRGPQVFGHPVDDIDQIANFIVARHLDLLIQIARGHRAQGDGNAVQAARHDTADPQGSCHGGEEGCSRHHQQGRTRLRIKDIPRLIGGLQFQSLALHDLVHRIADPHRRLVGAAQRNDRGFRVAIGQRQFDRLVGDGLVFGPAALRVRVHLAIDIVPRA
ncbi:hypothetical protein GGQ89_003397 [Sphingomonas yabuuchiae]|uniref:Uncharacterized protein n=1 Tax=Sphingomonas yabuuchiae TaxID=172044 RepID=A0ABR6KF83_9SPHN|nr:hypothetical protein [Sphingomonas yabuuchiae]